MPPRTRALAIALSAAVLLSSGALLGKVTKPKPQYNVKEIPAEKACNETKRAFPHARHVPLQGGACDGCHVLVTTKNALPGERPGEIRRPNHAPCLECHSDHPNRPSFFEKDDAKRTICQSCHSERADEKGKLVAGSENDPHAAPAGLDYSSPAQKPCDLGYGLDFSHAAHNTSIASCDSCHSVLQDKDEPTGALMVSTPGHPECFRCHDDGKSKQAQEAAVPSRCTACHTEQGSPNARRSYVSSGRDDFASHFGHASHLDRHMKAALEGRSGNKRCLSCHAALAETSSLFAPAAAKVVSSSTCFCCHYEGSTAAFGPKKCKECHTRVDIPVTPASHARGAGCSF